MKLPNVCGDYDAVAPGQAAQPTVVTITPEQIAEYARHCPEPGPSVPLRQRQQRVRRRPGADADHGRVLRTPVCGPKSPKNNGFTALEQSKTARRQTPFAKCEARWFQPAFVGDTITGVGRVLEKYERRGQASSSPSALRPRTSAASP